MLHHGIMRTLRYKWTSIHKVFHEKGNFLKPKERILLNSSLGPFFPKELLLLRHKKRTVIFYHAWFFQSNRFWFYEPTKLDPFSFAKLPYFAFYTLHFPFFLLSQMVLPTTICVNVKQYRMILHYKQNSLDAGIQDSSTSISIVVKVEQSLLMMMIMKVTNIYKHEIVDTRA